MILELIFDWIETRFIFILVVCWKLKVSKSKVKEIWAMKSLKSNAFDEDKRALVCENICHIESQIELRDKKMKKVSYRESSCEIDLQKVCFQNHETKNLNRWKLRFLP